MQKGCENMNRIFKVIWSKTRNCYVVASELAKGTSKSTSTGRMAKRAVLAAVAALLISPLGVGAENADYYTKDETNQKVAAANTYTYRKVAAEATARETADTNLDTRITNVKEYLENQTSENYVSKADAAVQDAGVVKANKKIGENVTALGKGLYDETAARIGADAAQDKVIQAVNDNLVQSVTTINKNVADGFTALNQADANEAAAREAADTTLQTNIDNEAAERKAADTVLDDKITAETSARVAADAKLVEAVNSGLSLSDKNVLQKNKTSVAANGTVTTSKEAATTLVMNEGTENQITLSENGIKVGLNSTVQDANGFYAGGDTAAAAKAALNADGSIKGANGAFAVDTSGNVTSGNVTSTGTVTGKSLTDGTASLSGGNLTGAHNVTADGTITGATLTDGKATISNGNIKTNGGFIQTGGGNVNTQGGEVRTNAVSYTHLTLPTN